MSDIELFTIPFYDDNQYRNRRLNIRVAKLVSIAEQFKIKDTWYFLHNHDDRGIIEFSEDVLDDLIEQLQRAKKLMVLK